MHNQDSRIQPSQQFITASTSVLQELVNTTNGIDAVLIASTDGFTVNSVFKRDYDAGKLSAVASSILSLVQALTREAKLTGCRSVILDAVDGKVMINAVPNANQPMIAMVLTQSDVLLAQVMHGLKKSIVQLVELDKQYHQTNTFSL